jgi:hypothetical protein
MLLIAGIVIHKSWSRNMEYAYPSPFWSREGEAVAVYDLRIHRESIMEVHKVLAQLAHAEGLQFFVRKSHPIEPWYNVNSWNRTFEISVSNLVYPEQLKLALYTLPGADAQSTGRAAFDRVVKTLLSLPGTVGPRTKTGQ